MAGETRGLIDKKEKFSVKEIVVDLKGMMNQVVKEQCTPDTVNAACNCADKMTNLLKLQLEYERMKNK